MGLFLPKRLWGGSNVIFESVVWRFTFFFQFSPWLRCSTKIFRSRTRRVRSLNIFALRLARRKTERKILSLWNRSGTRFYIVKHIWYVILSSVEGSDSFGLALWLEQSGEILGEVLWDGVGGALLVAVLDGARVIQPVLRLESDQAESITVRRTKWHRHRLTHFNRFWGLIGLYHGFIIASLGMM